MNGAPDWQDGECCFRCRTQFTLVARKHHCRNCGNIFCAKCSAQQIPLPKLNIEKAVRVCDGCYEKLSKNEDSLALALNKNSDTDQTKSSSSSNSKSTSGPSKSTSSNKPAANASAPSEQELKEEEELQLALALSLSEAPSKVSFPDCRQFEENIPAVNAPVNNNNHVERPSNNNIAHQPPSQSVTQSESLTNIEQPQYVSTPEKQQQTQPLDPTQLQFPLGHQVLDRDQELFRFVAEVQSTSEVFTNRINSNKLRNRPIANDSAIQSLFLKLTSMHTKLLEYIKVHDEERAGFEGLQDKLSQIMDARAALDALREEHQEKIRQEAAEAERQRQTQLASKLEVMRQKKSQMMQYQREIALQRIQAQEMMLRQPQSYQSPPNTVTQQVIPQPPSAIQQQSEIQQQHPIQQPPIQQQIPIQQQASIPHQSLVQQPPIVQTPLFQPHSSQPGLQFMQHQIDQSTQQSLPTIPKADDEAPLISFDD